MQYTHANIWLYLYITIYLKIAIWFIMSIYDHILFLQNHVSEIHVTPTEAES